MHLEFGYNPRPVRGRKQTLQTQIQYARSCYNPRPVRGRKSTVNSAAIRCKSILFPARGRKLNSFQRISLPKETINAPPGDGSSRKQSCSIWVRQILYTPTGDKKEQSFKNDCSFSVCGFSLISAPSDFARRLHPPHLRARLPMALGPARRLPSGAFAFCFF